LRREERGKSEEKRLLLLTSHSSLLTPRYSKAVLVSLAISSDKDSFLCGKTHLYLRPRPSLGA
jgi:hypothetical protein